MNVLYLTYGLPYPPHSGARVRDFSFLQQLAAHHCVTCVCLLEQPDEAQHIPALECLGVSTVSFPLERASPLRQTFGLARHLAARRPLATYLFWNAQMFDYVRALTAAQPFDVVQIEHSLLGPYLAALPAALREKTILDFHNIGAQQYRRMLNLSVAPHERVAFWFKQQLMQNWEARHAAHFARVLTVSRDDAQWLRAQNAALRVTVIENGVDTERCPFLPETAARNALLFVGTLGYPPNADAALWFCRDILPLIQHAVPDVSLAIVGRSPRASVSALRQQPGVRVHENVAALAPFYENANIVIVPLRAGGGTRLKILEAMAYGRAVVSTPLGAEGLEVREGETIALADSPQTFAARVIALLQNRAERERLARNARQLVETRYAWKHIRAKLLQVYDELEG